MLKGLVWLPIIETIYPSNFRGFQPVDDLGGIHLLIVMLAVYQNSIQILVHFAHTKYSGQVPENIPPNFTETFQFFRCVLTFECFKHSIEVLQCLKGFRHRMKGWVTNFPKWLYIFKKHTYIYREFERLNIFLLSV